MAHLTRINDGFEFQKSHDVFICKYTIVNYLKKTFFKPLISSKDRISPLHSTVGIYVIGLKLTLKVLPMTLFSFKANNCSKQIKSRRNLKYDGLMFGYM